MIAITGKLHTKRWLLGLILVAAGVLSLASYHKVAAQSSGDQPVRVYCVNKAPNGANCYEAAQHARNAATFACKKVTKKGVCITSKAKGYIDAANKGNPDKAKFKSQLAEVLKTPCKGQDKCPEKGDEDADKPLKADTTSPSASAFSAKTKNLSGGDECGNSGHPDKNVKTNFNFGCLGPAYDIKQYGAVSPVEDIVYAIIRFMSIGVGIIVVISIIIAGIQYTSSEGNPEVTQEAKNRVRFTMFGLFLYIFAYTIMQYLVPGGLFK